MAYSFVELHTQNNYSADPSGWCMFSVSPVSEIRALYRHWNGEFSVLAKAGGGIEELHRYSSAYPHELKWQTAEGMQGTKRTMAESADGATIVIDENGNLKRIADGAVTTFGPAGLHADALTQLPSGNIAMAGSTHGEAPRVWELDRSAGAIIRALTADYPEGDNIAIGPGGRFYVTHGAGSLSMATFCGSFTLLSDELNFSEGAVVLPNGDVLLAVEAEKRIVRVDGDTGEIKSSTEQGYMPRALQWHRSGKAYVAAAAYDTVHERQWPSW